MKSTEKKKFILCAEEEKNLEHINKYRITSQTEIPKEEYVFKVQDIGCMPLGDLSAVKAAPKKGKTTSLKRIVATALTGKLGQLNSDLKNATILWIDTEQKMGDAKLIIKDIQKMTGLTNKYLDKHLLVFSLRKIDCKTMLDDIKAAIKEYQPQVVVIDGIAEFVSSVNDETEAKKLIHFLMTGSESCHCSIICVLHENRVGNGDMKGHLGANLTQKAACVLECKKDGDVITVRCTDSRHQSTPEWSIRFDEQGNIVDVDGSVPIIKWNTRPSKEPSKKQQANALQKKERLDFCRNVIAEHGGSIIRKELVELLMAKEGLSRERTTGLLSEYIKTDKVLFENNSIITSTPSGSIAA